MSGDGVDLLGDGVDLLGDGCDLIGDFLGESSKTTVAQKCSGAMEIQKYHQRTYGRTDGPTDQRTNGPTDQRTDTGRC